MRRRQHGSLHQRCLIRCGKVQHVRWPTRFAAQVLAPYAAGFLDKVYAGAGGGLRISGVLQVTLRLIKIRKNFEL